MLVLGYLALIAGFGSFGLLQAMKIRRRPKEIREMINALALLDTEIYWGATPLPAAFAVVKERTEPPWQEFFSKLEEKLIMGENASSAWQASVREHSPKTCLEEEDWKIIADIGKGLGRSDRNEQHKHLELVQKHLTSAYDKVRNHADHKAKVWSYLGFLGGMAIVVFIM